MRAANSHNLRALTLAKTRFLDRVSAIQPGLAADLRNLQLPWYYIRNAVEPELDNEAEESTEEKSTTAEIFIYDEIGGSAGVSADEFVKDLQNIKEDSIMLRINSPGGSVFDAIAIYNALVQHPATVRTRVDALAASAASIVAMAADPYDAATDTGGVEMMVGSQLMIHDALGIEQGNARDMREMAAFLDAQSNNLASVYAARVGDQSEEAIKNWRNLMLAETWMFAQEAVDAGLADKIYMRPNPAEPDAEVPDEEPEEGDEESDDSEEPTDEQIVNEIQGIRHRLTNRGFKYIGRNKAPKPVISNGKSFADLVTW